jgi:hypothetical protein
MKLFETSNCKSRIHCVACRTKSSFRQQWLERGLVTNRDFQCPYGVTEETARQVQLDAAKRIGAKHSTDEAIAQRMELGRKAWAWLHDQCRKGLLTVERLKTEFAPMVPKYGCTCRQKWKTILKQIPFRSDDQFAWSVEVHNAVNSSLKKRLFTLAEVESLYPIDNLSIRV